MLEIIMVMDMFMAYTVVMVSWVYTYFQTHQVVYINYVQLFVWEKKRKKKATVGYLERAEKNKSRLALGGVEKPLKCTADSLRISGPISKYGMSVSRKWGG